MLQNPVHTYASGPQRRVRDFSFSLSDLSEQTSFEDESNPENAASAQVMHLQHFPDSIISIRLEVFGLKTTIMLCSVTTCRW